AGARFLALAAELFQGRRGFWVPGLWRRPEGGDGLATEFQVGLEPGQCLPAEGRLLGGVQRGSVTARAGGGPGGGTGRLVAVAADHVVRQRRLGREHVRIQAGGGPRLAVLVCELGEGQSLVGFGGLALEDRAGALLQLQELVAPLDLFLNAAAQWIIR